MSGCGEGGVDGVAFGALEMVPFSGPPALRWLITGSMALRRLRSRRMVGDVTPRVWVTNTSSPSRLNVWPWHPRRDEAAGRNFPVLAGPETGSASQRDGLYQILEEIPGLRSSLSALHFDKLPKLQKVYAIILVNACPPHSLTVQDT